MSETSKFTEDILTAAKSKAETILKQAEDETQRALDEAKLDISREADQIVRNARIEAEGVRTREISEIRHKLKLQEQEEKNKILSQVLEAAKKRVAELTNDEAKYLPYLASFIGSSIRELGSENVLIHLNATDLKRLDKGKLEHEVAKTLDKPAKIGWSKDSISALGGAIISTLDNRSRIVNTLDERFEALESKLLIEAGKFLFSK